MIEKIKKHQQSIVLFVGYLLVALMSFGLGKITALKAVPPVVKIDRAFVPSNYSENQGSVQSAVTEVNAQENGDNNCVGKIKGNINSKGDRIYHMPNGSFYNRTDPEVCFATEAEAKSAGFRKSSR